MSVSYPKKSRKKKESPKSEGISDLVKELWQAAVNLRGSIEPPDYKRYVLPLIFLRFLSLRYDQRRTELQRMVREKRSEYYTEDPQEEAEILADPDEYRKEGVFVIPEEARWDNIVKMARRDDVKVRLDDILEKLENAYPEKLRGLLPRIYAGSIWTLRTCVGSSTSSPRTCSERTTGART